MADKIIDVVIGKKKVKLSFFISMSPGSFFSLKSKT
jgi:flagellar motor switch/type III secretory pathway protein FliN